ncbi:DDB1- and CUL4-associated factor 11 [Nowakowskiella sp. JEL0078]|nr:DDB1- and CUL4-associated factor 11 [Nowakowskiella sp. JEL0078]
MLPNSTSTLNFKIHIYDTKNPSKFIPLHTISAREGQWTITDTSISPDSQFLAYSSITPKVYITRFDQPESEHIPYTFRRPSSSDSEEFGIWSIKFSSDGTEILAGSSLRHAGQACVFLVDVETKQQLKAIQGHQADVNAGSDDTFIKVWDRRTLEKSRPVGVLVGHLEGLTYITSKGDGVSCLSNSKDQTMKLWDTRKMNSTDFFDLISSRVDLSTGFDYRMDRYPGSLIEQKHPNDCSLVTYTGHSVHRTLIRCHFSPLHTTGQKFVYTGSADGKVRIFPIEGGDPIQVLDTAPFVEGARRPNPMRDQPHIALLRRLFQRAQESLDFRQSIDNIVYNIGDIFSEGDMEELQELENTLNVDIEVDYEQDQTGTEVDFPEEDDPNDPDWTNEDTDEDDDFDIDEDDLIDLNNNQHYVTRDVSWHPFLPVLVSTNWIQSSFNAWGAEGCITKHRWNLK